MDKNNDLRNKFNSLLVDYLNTFNFLELNVGLCITHLSELETHEIHKKIEKLNFAGKIEYFLKLIGSENNKKDLHTWCEDAHSKRHERNMYMHGQWTLFPHVEQCVKIEIAPWVKEKYVNIYPDRRFTLLELEGIVTDIKKCFEQFQALRTKYGI